MAETLRKVGKYLFFTIFISAFLWVIAQLFLNLNEQVAIFDFGKRSPSESLTLVYPDEVSTLEPTLINSAVRQRLVNVYEPLVKFDANFKIKPALALSWGLIDDYTWEFRLRKNVEFHDGTSFGVDDALASLARARTFEKSELKDLLKNVVNVYALGDDLIVKTASPDPLLLQKLTFVFMLPKEEASGDDLQFVGTGPYRFVKNNEGTLEFEKFANYYGNGGYFKTVKAFSKTDKFERVRMLLGNEADFLTFVPYDAVEVLENEGFKLSRVPSLELQFLVFNMKSKVLDSVEKRQMISLAISGEDLSKEVGGETKVANQFVSEGVFGFNPKIAPHKFDLEEAKNILKNKFEKIPVVQIHLPLGLNVLGEHLRKNLADVGVETLVSYLELPKLLESIKNSEADLYFLAYKADLGDSSSFFQEVLLPGAAFNVGVYSNSEINSLFKSALSEMDERVRRNLMQEAMAVAVEKDPAGVPLFEYETVYGFSDDIDYVSRLDGMIYFDDIIKK